MYKQINDGQQEGGYSQVPPLRVFVHFIAPFLGLTRLQPYVVAVVQKIELFTFRANGFQEKLRVRHGQQIL